MNGNIQNSSETLKLQLKSINYGKIPTFQDLVQYNPAIFLQIVHYILIDYSPAVYGYIVDKDYDLYAKTDLRFIQCVYKVMLQEFNIKPSLNINQFFTESYLESKINFCLSLISSVKQLDAKLTSKRKPLKPKSQNQPTKEDLPLPKNEDIDDTYDLSKSEIKDSFYNDFNNDTNISMKKRAPEPVSLDLDFSHSDDLAPLSHVPIKPQRLDGPEFTDKENQGNIINQQAVPEQQQKSKKDEKTNQQTKEILKMIVDMNDAFMTMTKKFEGFQNQVEGWMKNVNAQMVLMESNFKVLKAQVGNKGSTSTS